MAELHVTNGDVAAEAIRRRLQVPSSSLVVWRDVLHCGPVPADEDDDTLRATRAAFLGSVGWADADDVRIGFAARDAAVQQAVDLATRLTLWFEDDLYDQLQLIQVLDHLRAHRGPITLIDLPRKAVDIGFLYGTARPLDGHHVALGVEAWAAFRADTPLALFELATTGTPLLPDLAPALIRHLEDLPGLADGLARTERQTLAALTAGPLSRMALFVAVSRADERPFLGDTAFFWWLEGLAAGPVPLVTLTDDGLCALTDAGRRCLAGEADRVVLAGGIDRWHGGVHLVPDGPTWRWDVAARAPVAHTA